MLIYLVRHGQTQANADEICTGYTETDLTEVGIKQAQATGNILEGISFDAIFSSNVSRTQETARHIIKSDQEIIIEPLIQERNYGDFDGKPAIIKRKQQDTLGLTEAEFNEMEPSIEGNQQVIDRFVCFIEKYLHNAHYQNILLVSHGGFIRTIISYILQLNLGKQGISQFMIPVKNASISIIEYTPEKGLRLVTYNQHLHLLNLK